MTVVLNPIARPEGTVRVIPAAALIVMIFPLSEAVRVYDAVCALIVFEFTLYPPSETTAPLNVAPAAEIPDDARIVPFTSRVNCGDVVFTPSFVNDPVRPNSSRFVEELNVTPVSPLEEIGSIHWELLPSLI